MERYKLLEEVFLFGPDGPLNENRPFEVQSVWEHRGRLVFKFGEVDSISEAERLRGAEVRIPLTSRLEVAPDEYYQSDLIGCVVIESGSGTRVGRVKEWRDYGGAGLLEVEGTQAGEEILIPFASSICVDIDVKARRIVVKMPEGLKELNRS
jgi:16S rRNA processing protein RimM